MPNGPDPATRWVTNGELKAELDEMRVALDEKPGRWEVRFLIVVAIVLAPTIPSATDVAQAALGAIG